MENEYNFTFEEAIVYKETGRLPTRIIPLIGKKVADKVDKEIIKELNEKNK